MRACTSGVSNVVAAAGDPCAECQAKHLLSPQSLPARTTASDVCFPPSLALQVNLFKDDGMIIHFENPKGASRWAWWRACRLLPRRLADAHSSGHTIPPPPPPPLAAVQASIPANTYVISGTSETKSVTELLPGILTQMGQAGVKQLAETLQKGKGAGFDAGAGGAGGDEGAYTGERGTCGSCGSIPRRLSARHRVVRTCGRGAERLPVASAHQLDHHPGPQSRHTHPAPLHARSHPPQRTTTTRCRHWKPTLTRSPQSNP